MVREEWILSQWLPSILGKNTGWAGDRTSDLLFSSSQRYRRSYGARLDLAEMHLTLSQTSHGFTCLSLLKTLWEKEKLLVMSNFSFSHSVFYPVGELSAILIKFKIVICLLLQFRWVQNLLFGNGLNSHVSVHRWFFRWNLSCWLIYMFSVKYILVCWYYLELVILAASWQVLALAVAWLHR